MKKVRAVQVDFWTDEKVVSVSPLARLLFIGSWHYCCDQGHLEATPLELKMKVLPADNCDPVALIEECVEVGLFVRDDEGRLSVPKLPEHQRIDKRWVIRCELCTDGDPTSGTREVHTRSDTSGTREVHGRSPIAPEGSRDDVDGDVDGDGVGGAGGEAPKAPRKRGTRLPDIFPITDEMRQWGRDNAPDVDAAREHERFCDYWRGVSGQRGVKVDWTATWRNWMRKAQDDTTPRGARPADDRPDWMLA